MSFRDLCYFLTLYYFYKLYHHPYFALFSLYVLFSPFSRFLSSLIFSHPPPLSFSQLFRHSCYLLSFPLSTLSFLHSMFAILTTLTFHHSRVLLSLPCFTVIHTLFCYTAIFCHSFYAFTSFLRYLLIISSILLRHSCDTPPSFLRYPSIIPAIPLHHSCDTPPSFPRRRESSNKKS